MYIKFFIKVFSHQSKLLIRSAKEIGVNFKNGFKVRWWYTTNGIVVKWVGMVKWCGNDEVGGSSEFLLNSLLFSLLMNQSCQNKTVSWFYFILVWYSWPFISVCRNHNKALELSTTSWQESQCQRENIFLLITNVFW